MGERDSFNEIERLKRQAERHERLAAAFRAKAERLRSELPSAKIYAEAIRNLGSPRL